MRTVGDLFTRTIRKLYRQTGMGVCAVLVTRETERETAGVIGAFSIEGADLESMEFAAETLLDLVVKETDSDDGACPCCLDRGERARQALAVLRQRPATRTAH